MKRIGAGFLWLVGLYFVVRAVIEPFVIDLNDPASYQNDWGGPHLAGVLLVHCGLGLVAAALMAWRLMRRSSRRLRAKTARNAGDQEPEDARSPGAASRDHEPRPEHVHV